jgi:putative photosynthetic complex assembly protein
MVEPGTGGFLRGVLRGFARDRKLRGLGEEAAPFALTRWADGRLSVTDPATGRYVDLGAFGPDNWKAFAQLLETGDEVQ